MNPAPLNREQGDQEQQIGRDFIDFMDKATDPSPEQGDERETERFRREVEEIRDWAVTRDCCSCAVETANRLDAALTRSPSPDTPVGQEDG